MSEALFTADDRKAIILTAIQVSGPGASDATIATAVQNTARLLSAGSPAQSAFENLERQESRIKSRGKVKGTVVAVGQETLQNDVTRGVIVLFTGVTDKNPEGKEFFRSDILGTPQAPTSGNAVMRDARSAIGSVVLLDKVVEAMENGSGHGVRVARGIQPLSPDSAFDLNSVHYQPVWADPDKTTKTMLSRTRFSAVAPAPAA